MLTEIALTPQVFDQQLHEGDAAWIDLITDLGRRLAPVDGGPGSIIVSDLADGGWHRELPTVEDVKGIKDQRARLKLQGLLTVLKKVLVCRPLCGEWPLDEMQWMREAVASRQREPISRILVTREGNERTLGLVEGVRCFEEADDLRLWKDVSAQWSAPMVLAEQIAKLRPICVHAGFLAFASPYARANEQRFMRALIESARTRPVGFDLPSTIDIHTVAPGGQERLNNARDFWERKFHDIGRPRPQLTMWFWPDGSFRERILLAGDAGGGQVGARPPSSRWGVSLPHVALETDAPEDDPSPWQLLSREQRSLWHRRFYEHPVGKQGPLGEPLVVGPLV